MLLFSLSLRAEVATPVQEGEKKKISSVVVEHIMNHVADANENHIATIKDGEHETHISMPLPCILYNKTTESGRYSCLPFFITLLTASMRDIKWNTAVL